MPELVYRSAASLADAIRRRELSSVEVVEAHLRRIHEVNPVINAVVQLVEARAMDEARASDAELHAGRLRGPLHGVPMTIKDSLDTAGIISTGGTRGRERFVPEHDAPAVARLRSAGAVLLGKTNTPELTLGWAAENPIYGRTSNPYDLDRTPSGSSGGAAAIIAAGGSPLDLGSDTGGSIREPAHVCGITGIKPTAGRVPRTGHIVPYGLGALDAFTQIGPMARYVEDLALTLPLVCGVDWRDPSCIPMPLGDPADVGLEGLRVATYTDNGLAAPIDAIARAVRESTGALEAAGVRVQEAVPDALGPGARLIQQLREADGGAWVRRLLDRFGTETPGPMLDYLLTGNEPIPLPEFGALLEELDEVRSRMLGFMRNFDAIVCPPLLWAALPHDTEPHDKYVSWINGIIHNLTGWPAGVVRAGATPEGLPVGVQVVGRPWREDVVLALLGHIEASLGGFSAPPLTLSRT